MKKILQVFILVLTVTASSSLFAQPGCPEITIQGKVNGGINIPCGQTCTTLNATAFSAAQTTSYTVGQIAYNPPFSYTAGTSTLVAIDDVWGPVINLPFNFCFFGNTYNQIVVGSNGMISFNINNTPGTNNWQIQGPIPATYFPDITNSIMGPWQDLDPTNQGQIHYQISGTYPCRSFEVSWYQCPYYGDPNSVNPGTCNTALFGTQQIVLYETTNAIEVYIQNKALCTAWNNGRAIEGIQNATGTVAYTVPGRNATQWTASNDAWRFTPAGPSNTTIAWFDGATQIGTGSSIQVCPTISHSYTAQAVYTNCDATTTTVNDYAFVGISGITTQIDSTRNPSCNNGNNGAAYASFVSSGSAVLSYGWTPGGVPNQTSITNIPAGTYIFHVTDSTLCTKYDTVVISNPPPLTVSVPDSNAYSCTPGVVSGSLVANPAGGDTTGGNYSYIWTNAATTQSISGLSAGCYTVTVADVNGCTASDQGCVVAVVAPPVFNPPTITNVSCSGGSDGSITASLGQSVPPITYTWSNSLPSGPTVTGLSAGTYSVTGTDVNGCSATASYTITEPTPVTLGNPTLTQATCTVGGSICVTPTGGGGTFVYSWSNGGSGNCADSLAAGSYNLTVTDQNLCSATATYTVTSIAGVVTFGTPTIVDVLCNGGSTGSITATATGGTGPITYSWSNLVSGAVNSGIPAGSYSVTISDTAGCSASTTYTVNEPTPVVMGVPVITQATCQLGGSISDTATGGTGTLVYSWSNNQAGNTIDSLAAGPYSLTVTDQNGCSASASYLVPADSTVVTFGQPTITDLTCNGDSSGSITATASGGTGIIQFFWSYNNTNASTISGLAAGSYSVTITDQNSCTASTTYTVNQPAPVTVGNPVITQVTCASAGSICVTAAGGSGGYSYNWSNNETGNCIDSLAAGPYQVTVLDQNQCSVSGSFTVTGAPGVVTFGNPVIINVNCNGNSTGSITVNASGGTGTINYIWSNSVTGNVNSNIAVGCYTVTISDANSCSASTTYCVTQPPAIVLGNPVITQATCSAGGSISVIATGGVGILTYTWSNNQTGDSIGGLAAGPYTLTVTDGNLCSIVATYTVTANSSVVSFLAPDISNEPCHGDTTGSIFATATGGTAPITFAWSNQQSGSSITNLSAGVYSVTITDQNGCSASTTYVISQPSAIVATISYSSLVCLNTTGSATVSASGGVPGYTYQWNNNSDSSYTDNLFPGNISVTVTDASECSVSAAGNIQTAPDIAVTSIAKPFPCVDPPYGNDTILATSGLGPFTYVLVGVDTNSTGVFNNLPPGNYTWIIYDSLGCSKSSIFTIPQSAANDSFDVATDSTTCFNFSDGAVVLTTESSNGPYTYSLNGGTPQSDNTFSNLAAGTYTIVASNEYGCQTTVTAVVNQPAQASANASPDSIITAPGVDNAITVTTQNFANPVFSWTPETGLSCTDCFNPTANVTVATVFYVTVSEADHNNCSVSDSVVVIVTGGFVMPNAFTPNGDGKNDLFGPVSFGALTIKEFRIYNRWGELVFNANQGWDGTFKGKAQPAGTFVYYIQVQHPDVDHPGTEKTETKEGSFALIR